MISEILNYFYEIPLIGGILKSLLEFNAILGVLLIVVLATFIINSIVSSHIGYNFIAHLFELLKKYLTRDKYARKRKLYYDASSTQQYADWQLKVTHSLYKNDIEFTKLGNKIFPMVSYLPKNYLNIREFSKQATLTTNSPINTPPTFSHQQKEYYNLISPTIRRPHLIGFELDQLILDENDCVESFSAKICTYKENVLTSHYLDYELFLAYEKFGDKFLDMSKNEKLINLPHLNEILSNHNINEITTTGINRHSLLSVQMMVVFKHNYDDVYKTLLIQRSQDVAVKPGYWQIVPSGGFEVFEKTDQKLDSIIQSNFNVELAIYRELAEEIFNFEEFTHNEGGNAKENILVQQDIQDIQRYIKDGTATLDFIGSVTDLVSFRAELCFLLFIETPDFSLRTFKSNHEGKDIQIRTLDEVQTLIEQELFNPTSIGLYNLALNHPKLQEVLNEEMATVSN